MLSELRSLMAQRMGKPRSSYADAGYFLWTHPQFAASRYTYANWGSRRWEYCYAVQIMDSFGIQGKQLVDIGIGLPESSNFYTYYVNSGCRLLGVDLDSRLPPNTTLSESCSIIRQSATSIPMENGSVDFVIAISSLEHFPIDILRQAIIEIQRVLKPKGKLLITLDETIDHRCSAPWAIAEKTYNGLPAYEHDFPLPEGGRPFTIHTLLQMLSPGFLTDDVLVADDSCEISNACLPYLESVKWNSRVSYCCVSRR